MRFCDVKARRAESVTAVAARECGVDVRSAAELEGLSSSNNVGGRVLEVRGERITVNNPTDLLLARSLLAAQSQEESTPAAQQKYSSWYATTLDQ